MEKFSFVNLYCGATLETTEGQVLTNKKNIENQFSWFNNTTEGNVTNPV